MVYYNGTYEDSNNNNNNTRFFAFFSDNITTSYNGALDISHIHALPADLVVILWNLKLSTL